MPVVLWTVRYTDLSRFVLSGVNLMFVVILYDFESSHSDFELRNPMLAVICPFLF